MVDQDYMCVTYQLKANEVVYGYMREMDEIHAALEEEEARVCRMLSVEIASHGEVLLSNCEKMGALDLALGRGGDQAAIKTKNGYDFYGGVAKGVEKRTKVKTRIVANALLELIQSSSNVILMGHRFADLDSLGSAVGVAMICKTLGRNVKIVMIQ